MTDLESLTKTYEELTAKLQREEERVLSTDPIFELRAKVEEAKDERNAALYQHIIDTLTEENYRATLNYVDYRENLYSASSVLQNLLFGDDEDRDEAIDEVLEWYADQRYEYVHDYLTEILNRFDAECLRDEGWDWEIEAFIQDKDDSDVLGEIISNTAATLFRAGALEGFEFNVRTQKLEAVDAAFEEEDPEDPIYDSEYQIVFKADPDVFWKNRENRFQIKDFKVWYNGGPLYGDGDLSNNIEEPIELKREDINLDAEGWGYSFQKVYDGVYGFGYEESTVIPVKEEG